MFWFLICSIFFKCFCEHKKRDKNVSRGKTGEELFYGNTYCCSLFWILSLATWLRTRSLLPVIPLLIKNPAPALWYVQITYCSTILSRPHAIKRWTMPKNNLDTDGEAYLAGAWCRGGTREVALTRRTRRRRRRWNVSTESWTARVRLLLSRRWTSQDLISSWSRWGGQGHQNPMAWSASRLTKVGSWWCEPNNLVCQ